MSRICLRSFNASTQLSIFPLNFCITLDKRTKTVGSLAKSHSLSCRRLNAIACSRIHCRAFSRFPAAIKLELDECSLTNVVELVPAALLLLLECPLSFDVEWELIDVVRPQRAGFNEAKNDDVFDDEPKRERDDEPDELLPLAPAAFSGVDEVDGVLRPEEPLFWEGKQFIY